MDGKTDALLIVNINIEQSEILKRKPQSKKKGLSDPIV